ncbi:MAG: PA14 domain-containing protein, partial [Bacteroidota bacterium]
EIEEAGEYYFYTKEDDALKVIIDGELVVDAAEKRWKSQSEGSVYLTKGKHRLKVEHFDNVAFEYLQIEYASETMPRQQISGDQLFRVKVDL